MTNTEHTPGPWKHYPARLVDSSLYKSQIQPPASEPCSPGAGYGLTKEQAEANARLIAAAPAQAIILDLIQQGLMTLAEGEAEFDGVMYWFDARQPDWRALVDGIGWDTARTAIAAARIRP
jgi:hypothetical protein